MENISFLEQTAKDYDIPLWKVKEIYYKYGTMYLYAKLEDYLKERANQNKG